MKKTPWKRFAFWVRWCYPRQEAEEILADYKEMPDPDLSSPLHIIRDLGISRSIWRWLAMFGLLSGLLFIPILWFFQFIHYYNETLVVQFFPVLGSVLILLCFRREKKEPFSKDLIRFLLVELLLFAAAAAALVMVVICPQYLIGYMNYLGSIWEGLSYLFDFSRIMTLLGLAGAFLAFLGLNRARTEHRRWCGAYVLGLTILCLCICVLGVIWDMGIQTENLWMRGTVQRALRVMALGLAFTGVSLC